VDDIPIAPEDAWRKPPTKPGAASPQSPATHAPPRRNFFVALIAGVIGAVVGLVPLAAGVAVYLDPLFRKKKASSSAIQVASIDKLPDSAEGDVYLGQFPVIADRTDAWNMFPNERIGSVYLVVPKGTKQVKAFNAICPHLGCMVDMQTAGEGFKFKCPCHTSAFNSDGSRIMPCVAPRDMDELECRTDPHDGRVDVLVVFQSFQPGLAEKKAKS
jgi:menaquinol-cytochrome c reductase iron-sulfur subunit